MEKQVENVTEIESGSKSGLVAVGNDYPDFSWRIHIQLSYNIPQEPCSDIFTYFGAQEGCSLSLWT